MQVDTLEQPTAAILDADAEHATHRPIAKSTLSGTAATTSMASLTNTAPGQLRVIKRNGAVVPYDASKISVAITKAFLAVEGGTAAASSRIRDLVARLGEQVSTTFERRLPSGGTLHIEDVQDQVELVLMRSGEHKASRTYVLYREERARIRAERAATEPAAALPALSVTLEDGSTAPLNVTRLREVVSEACAGLDGTDGERILREALRNMYDGIAINDVGTSLLITARTLVEEEPNYAFATARLLMDELRREALTFLGEGLAAAAGDSAPSANHHANYRARQRDSPEGGGCPCDGRLLRQVKQPRNQGHRSQWSEKRQSSVAQSHRRAPVLR